ncbi:MAG: MerR family transcriptional regulator [[Eubacterium] siraeum]
MMTVNDVSKMTGVSIRTLQYYDNIGLLKPSGSTDTGYRLYDDTALERLQQILLFRELEFSLKDISRIISADNFDRDKALEQQIELLTMKRERIDNLIEFARKIRTTGVDIMDFSVFDTKKMKEYEAKAKEQWGNTAQYEQYEEKTSSMSDDEKSNVNKRFMMIFAEFGKLKDKLPDSKRYSNRLKPCAFITDNYYDCNTDILSSLGTMYAAGGELPIISTGTEEQAGGIHRKGN